MKSCDTFRLPYNDLGLLPYFRIEQQCSILGSVFETRHAIMLKSADLKHACALIFSSRLLAEVCNKSSCNGNPIIDCYGGARCKFARCVPRVMNTGKALLGMLVEALAWPIPGVPQSVSAPDTQSCGTVLRVGVLRYGSSWRCVSHVHSTQPAATATGGIS
jgi:hypothetical protein